MGLQARGPSANRDITAVARRWVPWVVCLLVFCFVRMASAEQNAGICDASRLRLDGQMGVQWMELLLRACEELKGMPDLDPTASVRVAPSGEALMVEVRLQDGRATVRRVTDPGALTDTLRALLTLPPKPAEEPPPIAATPSSHEAEARPAADVEASSWVQSAPIVVHEPAEKLRVEVGAMASGNVSASPTYLGVGPQVVGTLYASPWIFGVTTRWYAVQRLWKNNLQRFEMQTIAASLDFGRRFESGAFALDVGAGPWLFAESQTVEQDGDEKAGTETDVRFGGFARALVGRPPLRWSFQLDASISPWRVNRTLRMDEALPGLPAWGLGVGIGAVWSEP